MTQEHPFQASIVGLGTMPLGHREKWAFLKEMIKDLHPNQAIRLVLPSSTAKRLRPDIRWGRLCKKMGMVHRSRIARNGSDNITMYLWYEAKEKA